MREIKFRAWDRRRKIWEYFTLSEAISGTLHDISLDLENECQHTGIKAKNGVIYEGDILRTEDGKHIVQVIFRDGCFLAEKDRDENYIAVHNRFEIIGNVFENPELLKAKYPESDEG